MACVICSKESADLSTVSAVADHLEKINFVYHLLCRLTDQLPFPELLENLHTLCTECTECQFNEGKFVSDNPEAFQRARSTVISAVAKIGATYGDRAKNIKEIVLVFARVLREENTEQIVTLTSENHHIEDSEAFVDCQVGDTDESPSSFGLRIVNLKKLTDPDYPEIEQPGSMSSQPSASGSRKKCPPPTREVECITLDSSSDDEAEAPVVVKKPTEATVDDAVPGTSKAAMSQQPLEVVTYPNFMGDPPPPPKNLIVLCNPRDSLLSCFSKTMEQDGEIMGVYNQNHPSQAGLYLCTVLGCGRAFLDRESFSLHVSLHSGDMIPSKFCPKCDHHFNSIFELDIHKIRVHGMVNPFQYFCVTCSKECGSQLMLSEHIWEEHDKKKPFGCVSCARRFPSRVALYAHVVMIHPCPSQTDERTEEEMNMGNTFSCSICHQIIDRDGSGKLEATVLAHVYVKHGYIISVGSKLSKCGYWTKNPQSEPVQKTSNTKKQNPKKNSKK